MTELGTFYRPSEIDLETTIKPYQEAFRDWPWYEVSKCVDEQLPQRCAGALSRVAIGDVCSTCDLSPRKPAYERDELITKFELLASTRPTAWYAEQVAENMALGSIAWAATSAEIAAQKYGDVPEMASWLENNLGQEPLVWLDEVFASKEVRPQGNLKNFKTMCDGFVSRLGGQTLAFRTVNPAMTRAAIRDFGEAATIFNRCTDVPDRRDFTIIRNREVVR